MPYPEVDTMCRILVDPPGVTSGNRPESPSGSHQPLGNWRPNSMATWGPVQHPGTSREARNQPALLDNYPGKPGESHENAAFPRRLHIMPL